MTASIHSADPDLLATAPTGPVSALTTWLGTGGVFLWLILLCAAIAMFVILVRLIWLRRPHFLPPPMLEEYNRLEIDAQALVRLSTLSSDPKMNSPLATVTKVALEGAASDIPDLEGAVEARARREVAAMHWGLPVLEVVVTVAPLLGLLGTAAGLVDVFGGLAEDQRDLTQIALGVGKALSTTIAGLAVAVPAVIALTLFQSNTERAGLDMEVLLHRLVSRIARPSASRSQARN